MKDCTTIVLAGGKGSRLDPLTRDRAKPAVPFGGRYRIIDFALSNCLNSGLRRILLLTQYKGLSLDRHVNLAWRQYFCRELGEYVDVAPPQQRIDENWYAGTADAVYQNIYSLEKDQPKQILILAGDHIYKMDYRAMIESHRASGAQLTIGALPVSPEDATQFGVMEIDDQSHVMGFEEKPTTPRTMPKDEDHCLASMGIYVFDTEPLFDRLCRNAASDSSHDFGRDIIPGMIQDGSEVHAFPFRDLNQNAVPYWRDVGTIDAYYRANMDLVSIDPQLNLYDANWPIRSYTSPSLPPPKFVFDGRDEPDRRGVALNSIVGAGTIISGGLVDHCLIGNDVRVNSYSRVVDSILFDNVHVGRNARICRTIIDKHVRVPADFEVGFDAKYDRDRGFHVTSSGVVVLSPTDNLIPTRSFHHDTRFAPEF